MERERDPGLEAFSRGAIEGRGGGGGDREHRECEDSPHFVAMAKWMISYVYRYPNIFWD